MIKPERGDEEKQLTTRLMEFMGTTGQSGGLSLSDVQMRAVLCPRSFSAPLGIELAVLDLHILLTPTQLDGTSKIRGTCTFLGSL